jgi:hypothetical protein
VSGPPYLRGDGHAVGDAAVSDKQQPPDDEGGGSSYVVLIAVVLGVGLFYWLASTFFEWNKVQICVGYGRRNCTPAIQIDKP